MVTRLKQRYPWEKPAAALFTLVLPEFGDFPMMRRVLKGINKRAAAMRSARRADTRTVGVDLYWLPLGAGGWFVRLNGRVGAENSIALMPPALAHTRESVHPGHRA